MTKTLTKTLTKNLNKTLNKNLPNNRNTYKNQTLNKSLTKSSRNKRAISLYEQNLQIKETKVGSDNKKSTKKVRFNNVITVKKVDKYIKKVKFSKEVIIFEVRDNESEWNETSRQLANEGKYTESTPHKLKPIIGETTNKIPNENKKEYKRKPKPRPNKINQNQNYNTNYFKVSS